MAPATLEEAKRLRAIAHAGPIGKRHSSFALYSLLASCMALANQLDVADEAALRSAIRESASKRWLEAASDRYLTVCRFVFPNGSRSAERSNASRYAAALRFAHQQGISPEGIEGVLRTSGGINALYLKSKHFAVVRTRTLHLTQPIEARLNAPFTLELRLLPNNSFEVMP